MCSFCPSSLCLFYCEGQIKDSEPNLGGIGDVFVVCLFLFANEGIDLTFFSDLGN